tara:strand:+ start:833 stop:1078 length:246 start_codon:yes stop_codon:yes gene_type:complete
MIDKKSWAEFRESGLLWVVNRTLHLFGWSIVIEMDGEDFVSVYPARVTFRGFSEKTETDGFIKVSEYLEKNIAEIKQESAE